MTLGLIVACGESGQIGLDGTLPWKLPSELAYFKRMTMGSVLIMGRKTFDSLGGRPLPGRDHIVLSRTKIQELHPFVYSATSINQALDVAGQRVADSDLKSVFVCGGAQIYKVFLPLVQKVFLTEVDYKGDGDTFFPKSEIQKQPWLLERQDKSWHRAEKDSHSWRSSVYVKRP